MATKEKAAGRQTRAAFSTDPHSHLTERLSRTKRLLVGAYGLHALSFAEAELIASRLRRAYPHSWRAA
jgi:hypothetical protein